jgi:hypothetical protein
MQALEAPFKLYADTSGKPLDQGYVYFGLSGQDPVAHPVTVYWVAAGTITAAQPLRTVNGYIVNGTAPANVWFSGAYSEKVTDKNGVTVFSDLNRNSNPNGYLSTVTASLVNAAYGYTPLTPTSPVITGGATVSSSGSDFGATQSAALDLRATGGSSDAAILQFERSGLYAIKLGLSSDNTFRCGGWSMGANTYRYSSDTSGNFTALGNVTAYSDQKFKEEIEQLMDSIERTLMMRGVTYLDNRTGQKKIGAIAQDALRAGFPEAVGMDDHGLSLAYGQLALALVIENTRALVARIEQLKRDIAQLKGQ